MEGNREIVIAYEKYVFLRIYFPNLLETDLRILICKIYTCHLFGIP